jgi:hypothetical protein
VIIHEYKYTKDPKKQEDCYQDALWQIYERNYLSHPLSLSVSKSKGIEEIIVRAIVIVSAQANKSISLYMKNDIVHSVTEAQQITAYFSDLHTKNTLKPKEKNSDLKKSRQNLLNQ